MMDKKMSTFEDVVSLCEVAPSGPWIGGGSVRKHMQKLEQDADFDIFFRDAAQLEYLTNILDEDYGVTASSRWSRTYEVDDVEVQLITKTFHKDTTELMKSFDFTVCQFCYDSKDFRAGKESRNHVKAKQLILTNSAVHRSALFHSQKYIKRGYEFTRETIDRLVGGAGDNDEFGYEEPKDWTVPIETVVQDLQIFGAGGGGAAVNGDARGGAAINGDARGGGGGRGGLAQIRAWQGMDRRLDNEAVNQGFGQERDLANRIDNEAANNLLRAAQMGNPAMDREPPMELQDRVRVNIDAANMEIRQEAHQEPNRNGARRRDMQRARDQNRRDREAGLNRAGNRPNWWERLRGQGNE